MNNSNYKSYMLLKLLTSKITNTLIKKTPNASLKYTILSFKMKLLYSHKHEKSKINNNYFINVIKKNVSLESILKIVHIINFKDVLDQQQLKRSIFNTFTALKIDTSYRTSSKDNTFGSDTLKNNSYKTTLIINSLYQLYTMRNYIISKE